MHEQVLNMKGITYPVSLSQIPKFEKQNDISINVFDYEEKAIFPMKISKIKEIKTCRSPLPKGQRKGALLPD